MWRNHLEPQLQRRFITIDTQKKPLHHSMTGMECGGDTTGLARLPCVAAEMPEGSFSSGGEGDSPEKWGINPKLGYQPMASRPEMNPDDIQL